MPDDKVTASRASGPHGVAGTLTMTLAHECIVDSRYNGDGRSMRAVRLAQAVIDLTAQLEAERVRHQFLHGNFPLPNVKE